MDDINTLRELRDEIIKKIEQTDIKYKKELIDEIFFIFRFFIKNAIYEDEERRRYMNE